MSTPTIFESARQALAAHDDPSIEVIGSDGYPLIGSVERAEWVIAQLRPVVEPPASVETVEQIAQRVYMGIHSFPWLVHGDAMRDLLARGIRAGMEVARPVESMTTPEGVTYAVSIGMEYGTPVARITATFETGTVHTVSLVPSSETGEGPDTGNVFLYEDDEAVTHIAWGTPAEEEIAS